jgi:hypothetical protein
MKLNNQKVECPRTNATRLLVRIRGEQLLGVDRWIRSRPQPKPSRHEAIRQLVTIACSAIQQVKQRQNK